MQYFLTPDIDGVFSFGMQFFNKFLSLAFIHLSMFIDHINKSVVDVFRHVSGIPINQPEMSVRELWGLHRAISSISMDQYNIILTGPLGRMVWNR